ncbi:MAG: sulfite exporter TauE/SafE family protein [Paraglaciecola polaris]|uniref:sulfite exporter TauE/SafE family protein n=1 Tax=Paraglaciecola polaris TaxID=222814 RepID=UPI003001F329|tara:strand:+ start:633 stop:1367 length:735 start_codon:yes stop_codon:yes gene_type:complete
MLLVSAGLIGLSLGLLGAGGSILTVPALTLFLGLDEKSAITSSMIIIGMIAAVGSIRAYRNGALDKRIITSFGIVSLPFAALGARLGIWMPPGSQTVLLVAIMAVVALKMLADKPPVPGKSPSSWALLSAAATVGLITGVVGVGGGFLIVPALVIFAGANMQSAVSNSLLLIVINSATAFASIALSEQSPELNWLIILTMTGVGAASVLAGQSISSRLDQHKLKRGFSILIVVVAIWLLANLFY